MKARVLPSGDGVGRTEPPGAGDEALDVAGLPVEPLDDEDLGVGVLVVLEDAAGRDVLAEVDVAAVGGEDGLAGVLLVVGALGELQAVAAAAVVEPHLAGAEGALGGEVLAGDDVLAVGRPGRAVEQAERLLGDRARVRAVAVDEPDVVAAPLVAGEGDRLAVRAVAGLHLPGDVMGERPRLAAGDRDRVEIAQQVEGDLLAVRADVEVQPGPLGDVDRHLGRRSGRLVDVPLLLFLGGDLLRGALAPLLLLLLDLGRVLLGLLLALLLVLELLVRRLLLGSRGGRRRCRRLLEGQQAGGGEQQAEEKGTDRSHAVSSCRNEVERLGRVTGSYVAPKPEVAGEADYGGRGEGVKAGELPGSHAKRWSSARVAAGNSSDRHARKRGFGSQPSRQRIESAASETGRPSWNGCRHTATGSSGGQAAKAPPWTHRRRDARAQSTARRPRRGGSASARSRAPARRNAGRRPGSGPRPASKGAPSGMDAGCRAARRNASWTRSCASSRSGESRSARRKRR